MPNGLARVLVLFGIKPGTDLTSGHAKATSLRNLSSFVLFCPRRSFEPHRHNLDSASILCIGNRHIMLRFRKMVKKVHSTDIVALWRIEKGVTAMSDGAQGQGD